MTYVFEVHKSGSIDSLILNLQKAKSNPTVQRVIAVSDKGQLQKIKSECASLPEEFRKAMAFWDLDSVQAAFAGLQSALGAIEGLGLVKDTFGPDADD